MFGMNGLLRRTLPGLIIGALVSACTAHLPVSGQTESETIYVSMLGTRKHRLSGVNPVVGVFYSSDGGATWTHTGWEQGKAFAAVTPFGGAGDTLFVAAGNGVHRTTDAGREWRITTGWEVTEVQDVATSALRPSDVFAATPYGIFRSTDFAGSWTHVADRLKPPFVSSIRVDRMSPDHILAGTETGLYVSDDGGDSWSKTSLPIPVRSIRQSPLESTTWAAALHDRGVAISRDNGRTWTLSEDLGDATVYEVEFDPSDPQRLLAGGWKIGLQESLDGGTHWRRIDEELPSQDIHGIAISRATPGLVIIGTMDEGVFISRSGGRNWTAADPELFEAGQVWDVFVGGEQ